MKKLSGKIFILTWLLMVFIACSSDKTLLSDEIKNINTYRVGQKLTFVSNLGNENTLMIRNVKDHQFPDGLGAFLNERFFVSAYRESKTISNGTEERILTFLAKTNREEEKIDFSLSLKDTYLKMDFIPLSEYQSRTTFNLPTNFDTYDDVLLFENYPNRRIYESEIVEFYWSKSNGYVRLIQKNGIIWDLKNTE